MRRFKRKVNRGLLLGAVLLLGLAVFVIVSEVLFRQQIPDIRETVQAYVNALPGLNSLPEDAQVGQTLSAAQQEEQNRKLEAFLDQYWTEGEKSQGDGFYVTFSASDIRSYVQKLWNSPLSANFRDFSVLVPERSISVRASGAGYALVSVSVQDFNALCTGRADALFCGLCDEESVDAEVPGTDGAEEVRAERRVSYLMELSFEMKRVGGEWKIVSVSGYCAPSAEYEGTEVAE